MTKKLAQLQLDEADMRVAVEEYLNRRLFLNANVKVTSVFWSYDHHRFVAWIRGARKNSV